MMDRWGVIAQAEECKKKNKRQKTEMKNEKEEGDKEGGQKWGPSEENTQCTTTERKRDMRLYKVIL